MPESHHELPRDMPPQLVHVELAKGLEPSTTCFPAVVLGWVLLGLGFPVFPTVFACMHGAVSDWIGPSLDQRGGVSGGLAGSSHGPCSGAEEPAGVAGSRVDGVHHGVTRSALDAVRRWAESEAEGRRREGEAIAPATT